MGLTLCIVLKTTDDISHAPGHCWLFDNNFFCVLGKIFQL